MNIGAGIGIGFRDPIGGPADFSYGQTEFCDDDNETYTPTAENPGGTWSISPTLVGFNTTTGAFSPFDVTGTFVITHQFGGKTSTKTIVLNDSDDIVTFTYPFSSYPQGNATVPAPTITGTGPGINTGTFSATPAGLSINASTGDIDLTQSSINSYVITYTSGSEFCSDTATFTLEVENPYVGFKFRIVVPAGFAQTLALETVNGASTAPASVINWGDGTGVQALTTTTASNSFPTGTYDVEINAFNSTTFVDNFSVTSGEALVTQIIDWGGTPWYSLGSAFENCVNLTTFGTGTFKGSTGVDLDLMFKGCTSLVALDLTNWDLTSGCSIKSIVENCTSLELVNKPNQPIKLTANSQDAFKSTGTSLTNGCVFNLQGLDLSTSTNLGLFRLFGSSKIDPLSNFSDWQFNINVSASIVAMFTAAKITGIDSTLDVSGWSTLNTTNLTQTFFQINNSSGFTGAENLTLDISNLNVSNVTNMTNVFGNTGATTGNKISNIVGLSTLGSPQPGCTLDKAFAGLRFVKLTASDNISDAFMNGANPVNINGMFMNLGQGLTSDFGVSPNLASLDLSNFAVASGGVIGALFQNVKVSDVPDFSNVTWPSIPQSFSGLFFQFTTSGSNLHLDLSNADVSVTSMYAAFRSVVGVSKITLGDNVDFSNCTSFLQAFLGSGNATTPIEVILPTNADYGNVTSFTSAFSFYGPNNENLTTCVGDTLIRRIYATALNNNLSLSLVNTKLTGAPSVVDSYVTDLTTSGWTITSNGTDAVMPFVYTTPLTVGVPATPTGSFTGGTFSSSDATNVPVDVSTGEIDAINAGNATIRYTLADGCYNEQALVVALPLAQVNNVYSMEFDSLSDQYIDCGDSDVFSFGNGVTDSPFSISAWVNMPDATNFITIAKDATGGREYVIRTLSDDKLYFYLLDSSSNGYIGRISPAVTSNQGNWIHTVYTYNGNSSSSGIKIYLNGSQVDNANYQGGSYTAMENTNTALNIGRQERGLNYTSGLIDEVAVFNVELTEQEVQSIYNATETGKTADLNDLTTPPVKWYRMGD